MSIIVTVSCCSLLAFVVDEKLQIVRCFFVYRRVLQAFFRGIFNIVGPKSVKFFFQERDFHHEAIPIDCDKYNEIFCN